MGWGSVLMENKSGFFLALLFTFFCKKRGGDVTSHNYTEPTPHLIQGVKHVLKNIIFFQILHNVVVLLPKFNICDSQHGP
jgi:hypothetical protein